MDPDRRNSASGARRRLPSGATVALIACSLPPTVAGHHSHAEFSDDMRRLEGDLVSVTWRNPHPAMTLTVTADGREETWQIQVLGNVNGLRRNGVTGERFTVGRRVRIDGYLSERRERLLLATLARFEDGSSAVLGPDESSGSAVYGAAASAASPADEPDGLFRVWTVAERVRTADLPLRASARAAKEAWDSLLDDPQRGCRPLGMPGAMMSPHPIEFTRRGEAIILRLEEWDATRTIHMAAGVAAEAPAPSALGYSVGRWEGPTLLVNTTRIDYPYLDEHGTPQSDAVEVLERFTLGRDGRSLDWTATVIDPETFTEPFVAFTTRWVWIPGETLQRYDCVELDPLDDAPPASD